MSGSSGAFSGWLAGGGEMGERIRGRKRAEALAEIDRAKTLFFSNISHEFRNPLTLMLGPLGDAPASPGLPAKERERLDTAHRNSLRLLKLVNTLLDFSRTQAKPAMRAEAYVEEALRWLPNTEVASSGGRPGEPDWSGMIVNAGA